VSDLFRDLFGGGTIDQEPVAEKSGGEPPATTSAPKVSPFGIGKPGIMEVNPGVSGDIEFTDTGATIRIHRENGGTVVSGFYGSNSRANSRGVVQQWCSTRPWATNFLSRIIPSGFFDGLCVLRGYQVTSDQPQAGSNDTPRITTPQTTFVQPPANTNRRNSQPTTTAKPKLDIWAVPAQVRLGSRTTIFWNATNVVSCQETSPDVGFSHNTLSGGAETVALSGPATFVISCVTASGENVSNYTVVNLAN
jgi:hypothetical protein